MCEEMPFGAIDTWDGTMRYTRHYGVYCHQMEHVG